ncbi:MAG: glycerophosphodiester phosphodiesterase family protein [Pirellulales bacterium]
MTDATATAVLSGRDGFRALLRGWQPLVFYQLLMSLVIAAVVSPWLLTLSYTLIEFSGEPVLGNTELAAFLASPLGLASLALGLSVLVALLFVEYAGLIVLTDAALRGETLTIRQLVATMLGAAPQLLGLAVVSTSLAVASALPFVGLAVLAYWLLLAGSDINFYLAARPPRFWVAVAIGAFLACAIAACLLRLLIRWAFAVPACALAGHGWREAMRWSAKLVRGRAWRLLCMIGGWLLLKYLVLATAAFGLDWINGVLMDRLGERLSTLVWSVVALILLDAFVMQLVAAVFAIGTAGMLALAYEQARRSHPDSCYGGLSRSADSGVSPDRAGMLRAAIVAIAVLGPLASVAYPLLFSSEIVTHREVRVTAHRAGPTTAPENSVTALRLAIAARADCVEIDVQQTSDGHVVLVHDRDMRRVTGDSREVADVSLIELGRLRLLNAGQPTDERIPTLAEFLDACDEKLRLNVEMKDFGRSPNLGAAVAGVLREQGFLDRAVVSSFQLPPLFQARQAEPALPIGAILSAAKGDMTRLPVNFLSLNERLVTAELVRRAHRRNMEVHVWTVNDRESAVRLMDLGCDNLITRQPALMRQVVDWYAELDDIERMLLRLRRWMRE